MQNFYVIELQTHADGTSGNLVYGFENEADAKEKFFYASAAAVKSTPLIHAVVMLNSHGHALREHCETHPGEAVPVPEEPVVEE